MCFPILLQIKITVSKEGALGDVPIGVIIGSVIGGLLLFVLATVILWKVCGLCLSMNYCTTTL